ncbi:MAG TPA: glycine/sarcosine/betaine reductase component B subunit [Chloroflexota bacterium]|nr:glycine/sarcosine/betaine reductase component B subunit [Chloroflexota bacterium]
MRLTQHVHEVASVGWGERTSLAGSRLTIDKRALQDELLKDDRLLGVDLELARPGESCRIVNVFDVVEPRAKIEPDGADFPGILGRVQSVGYGTTRVLSGAAVTVLDPVPPPQQMGRNTNAGHVLDLGPTIELSNGAMLPTAEVSLYAGLHHVVVIPRLADGVTGDAAHNAARVASVRAAAFLARSVEAGTPDEERVFELTQVSDELPRIAYVYQLHSHQIPTVTGEPLLYGDNCRRLLPTILHPNEVLDGAVVRSYYQLNMLTYGIQNNAVIHDLYARHGRELNFVGMVVNVANVMAEERDRSTILSSNLVKWTLKADGVVLTKTIGGAPHVDMGLVAARCEELGVKSAMLVSIAGEGEDSALFNDPSLNAIVSTASSASVKLGPVERVIAAQPELAEQVQAGLTVGGGRFSGSSDHLGSSRLTTARY